MRVRIISSLVLVALLTGSAPSFADDGSQQKSGGSKGKRAAWIALGAGAGFAGGVFLGLDWFDDATNSDRKVWLTAISFAAAGAITAALLTRNDSKPSPVARLAPARELIGNLPAPSFLAGSKDPSRLENTGASDRTELAARLRAINLERRE